MPAGPIQDDALPDFGCKPNEGRVAQFVEVQFSRELIGANLDSRARPRHNTRPAIRQFHRNPVAQAGKEGFARLGCQPQVVAEAAHAHTHQIGAAHCEPPGIFFGRFGQYRRIQQFAGGVRQDIVRQRRDVYQVNARKDSFSRAKLCRKLFMPHSRFWEL